MKKTTRPRKTRAKPVTCDVTLWQKAFHEAAHAVIAARLGILGDSITIVPEGYEQGSVEFSKDGNNDAWKQWPQRYIRKAILAHYAGPAASKKLEPSLDLFEEGGWYECDMIGAEDLCRWIGDPAYYQHDTSLVLQTKNWQKAVELVQQNWPNILSVAVELIKRKTMLRHEVEALLN
jgi:hypothetical protein